MRTVADKLRDEGGELLDEAADEIEQLESDLSDARDAVAATERDVVALRERVAELEAARFCNACAFGTIAAEPAFCVGCGGRR